MIYVGGFEKKNREIKLFVFEKKGVFVSGRVLCVKNEFGVF